MKRAPLKPTVAENALVLGIGNILMKDDGLGVAVALSFKDAYRLPENIACLDGGVQGVNLLSAIEGFTHLIVIDAVLSGSAPGRVKQYEWDDLKDLPWLKRSAHGIGLKELLSLAGLDGKPRHIVVFGVTPKDVSTGMELTPIVKNSIPRLLLRIRRCLEEMGFTIKRTPQCTKAISQKR
ncbi:MAG: hydrogenase maturation protease [Deltaproteobacteria bacterium]|nr:hydrogenase maturation protease [Deltaproteobacteria bacterium]